MGTPKKEIDKEYLFNLLMPTAASDLPEDLPGCTGAVGGQPGLPLRRVRGFRHWEAASKSVRPGN